MFLVFPFLLLTTFQGRLLGATTAAAAVATVAIWSTFTDHGPIATFAGTNIIAKIHYLQVYIAVVLLSVLPLAALLGQREKRTTERYREVQAELAHASRVAAMGQLTASIAHEVKQPIAATVANAQAALRFLASEPVDLDEIRQIFDDIVKDGKRASEVFDRIRDLTKKTPPQQDLFAINEAIREVIELTHSEAVRNSVSVETQLAEGLPLIAADRIQLQQVVLNLIVNAIQAMSGSARDIRNLNISTANTASEGVLVAVRDSGPGLTPENVERLFEPFYTTKPGGMGMGLSISRSIIEAHGGRLTATANTPHGAIFQFTLPLRPGVAS